MSSEKKLHQSPLLRAMESRIVPGLKENGMRHIVVAYPTWREMQELDIRLPPGAYLTRKPLLSKKVPVRYRQREEKSAAFINARWPKDRLHAATMPVLGFVLQGDVAMPFGDYVLHCKPGHGYLILPGTPYSDGTHLCLEENAPETALCSMFSIRAWRQGIACWVNHTQKGEHWSGDAIQGEICHVLIPQIRQYLERLASEIGERAPLYEDVGEGILRVMMLLLLRELQQVHYSQPDFKPRGSIGVNSQRHYDNDESIQRALEYIHHNLHRPLSIEIVANHVYMSRAHFTRQFRNATGQTFNAYLKQFRLDTAKMLLENTQYPIEDIGRVIGISGNHLRLLFQRNLGITPQDYRRDARKKADAA